MISLFYEVITIAQRLLLADTNPNPYPDPYTFPNTNRNSDYNPKTKPNPNPFFPSIQRKANHAIVTTCRRKSSGDGTQPLVCVKLIVVTFTFVSPFFLVKRTFHSHPHFVDDFARAFLNFA